jgi:hypothetical protein
MKYAIAVAGLLISIFCTGCMGGYYTRLERRHAVERDSLMPPPMTIDDVVALAQDSVSDEVIISQIKATNSYFRLTTNDIRELAKDGVSSKVIDAMIKTATESGVGTRRASTYYYYPGYFWYPYVWYYGGWYPTIYFGYRYYGGYYGPHYGGYFGGAHVGGYRSGGFRASGRHR